MCGNHEHHAFEHKGEVFVKTVCFWSRHVMDTRWDSEEEFPVDKYPRNNDGDVEVVESYQPCEYCRHEWTQGCLIYETSSEPNQDGQLPIGDHYPTGRWLVISLEAFTDIVMENVKDGHITYEQAINIVLSRNGGMAAGPFTEMVQQARDEGARDLIQEMERPN